MVSPKITAIGDFASGTIAGADFKRLAGPDRALPAPPRFTFGTFPTSLAASYYAFCNISSVGVFVLQGFSLTGVFLISREDTFYRCPELNIHEAHIQAESDRLAPQRTKSRQRHLSGKHVILAGPGINVYGHWLAEYLPKISLLNFSGYDIFDLRYLLPTSAPPYVAAWLDLLGIRADQIAFYNAEAEVITADELLLPTILHNGCRMSPLFKDAANFLRELIEVHHDLNKSHYGARIFLSRSQGSQGRILNNRDRIEALASQANFSIVHPEQLGLVEQARLFFGAREIMGEYGSALHGSIFSPVGTVVCALRGTSLHPGFIQSGMGTVLQHPTGYLFGDADPNFGFEVHEDAVAAALRLVFGGTKL